MSIRKHILGNRKKIIDLGIYQKGQMILCCVILCVITECHSAEPCFQSIVICYY